MNNYGPEDEYDEYENGQDDSDEFDLLTAEIMGDNDSWERSNDEGWYYDDND
ncbi:MAG: hypothetical protein PHN84_00175 [Desulfuromonadaceae bacterium]|nr:hypothetical protein [Desulfuromonadaceae bacterium]MDD2855926.1 hypothetical protein [Desulfuromonadaceae bacterium]